MKKKISVLQWQPLLFLFAFFMLASGPALYGQSLYYDIYKGDDRIGEITVEKNTSPQGIHYSASSVAKFRLIFKNELTTYTAASFVDEELVQAVSKIELNDKIREYNTTQKQGHFYHYTQHEEDAFKKSEAPFLISTVMLYYAEPSGVQQVFSENYQVLCELKKIGPHSYELSLPGGKINQYFYEDGKLLEIKVFRTFVDLSFRLKEQV